MNPWLVALIILLSFAAGWVACAVFTEATAPERRGFVDLSGPAARGELLRLDWGDARTAASTGAQAVTMTVTNEPEARPPRLRAVE